MKTNSVLVRGSNSLITATHLIATLRCRQQLIAQTYLNVVADVRLSRNGGSADSPV